MDTLAILIKSGLIETDRVIDHGAESNTSDHSGSAENPFSNVYLPTTNYPKMNGNQNESKDVRIDLPVEIVDEGRSS